MIIQQPNANDVTRNLNHLEEFKEPNASADYYVKQNQFFVPQSNSERISILDEIRLASERRDSLPNLE